MTKSKYTQRTTGIDYPTEMGQDKIDKVIAYLKSEGITIASQENSMGNPYLIMSIEGSEFISLDETLGLEYKEEE
jgi:hypothetical protein